MNGTFLLLIYRIVSAGFGPFAPLFLFWRQRRGLEERTRVRERLGIARRMRLPGPVAWLHGASVGESLALLPLLEKLRARGFNILLTTGTVTSAAVIAPRLPPGSLHQYVPLDVPRFMARFLNHWRPQIVLIAESEIWPNLFLETRLRNIPLILVNARMSKRSFERWLRLPRLALCLLEKTEYCLAQSYADADRFVRLGAPQVHVAGNLKFDVAPPQADPQGLASLKARIGGRPVWVAAATHAGEEDVVFDAHRRLLPLFPGLLTIVVPRHPRRGNKIRALAESYGLPCQLRSQDRGDHPLEGIYVGDTIGETGLFYRLTGVVFLGKSLSAGGGQSPIEAAKLGCAILCGPYVANFAEIYQRLEETRGGATVTGAETLAGVLAYLFADAVKMRDMGRAAASLVESLSGASDYIMKAIEPHIAQMMVERGGAADRASNPKAETGFGTNLMR